MDSISTKTPSPTAVAEEGRKGEVREGGAIRNDLHALEKWIMRLRKAHRPDVMLERVTRRARAALELPGGPDNWAWSALLAHPPTSLFPSASSVVAPSMTPTRSGDPIKTDKRDARKLASWMNSLHKSYASEQGAVRIA